jgi:hypothetical protein
MACMCLLTGYSTRGFHGSLKYKTNARMDIKAVAVYDSSSSLERLQWNNIREREREREREKYNLLLIVFILL